MAEYISLPIERDPDELAELAFEYIEQHVPGWERPQDGRYEATFEVLVIRAVARMIAVSAEVASDVSPEIFRYFGRDILAPVIPLLVPIDAQPAQAETTWTAIDTFGHEIPAGTVVGIPSADGTLVPFEVQQDTEISIGNSSVPDVTLVATTPGAAGTGLSGLPVLIDPLEFVDTVTLQAATSGGIDAETIDEYLDRLASLLQLFAPRITLARDAAAFAQTLPEVDRALAIDNYIPGVGTGQERAITVVPINTAGEPVSDTTRTQLLVMLQAAREPNFVVSVIEPTYTTINVSFTVQARSGTVPADVDAAAEAAISEALSPANHGQPPGGETRRWVQVPAIRYLDLAAVLKEVEGVDYVVSLRLAAQGNPEAAQDVPLLGAAPLPRPGTIAGTVVAG